MRTNILRCTAMAFSIAVFYCNPSNFAEKAEKFICKPLAQRLLFVTKYHIIK